jgi:MoxR-like ATPase
MNRVRVYSQKYGGKKLPRPCIHVGGGEKFQPFGGSPRASIALAQASRAHAFLRDRAYVTPEDVRALAPDVLRHRIVLTFEAEAEDVTTDDVVSRVLGAARVP